MQAACPVAGVPFRETHHISGAAVKLAEDRGCTLFDLTVEDLAGINPLFTEDVTSVRCCQRRHSAWRLAE
jgi:argininosuccinate lyase